MNRRIGDRNGYRPGFPDLLQLIADLIARDLLVDLVNLALQGMIYLTRHHLACGEFPGSETRLQILTEFKAGSPHEFNVGGRVPGEVRLSLFDAWAEVFAH